MAFTVPISDRFAVGDTVKAYPASNWPVFLQPPSPGSLQVGAAAESAVVAADGTVTFTTLTEDTVYYLTKDGSGVYVRVKPDAFKQGVSQVAIQGTPTVAVSGTVPVSGPLTDAQLRASPVPVSGTVTAVPPSATPGELRKTVTTAGTRVALSATPLRVLRATVCAISTNTGVVVVGDSAVVAAVGSRNSPFLNAGDAIPLGPVDLSAVYVDSTVNGEGVTVLYET